jgi:hypothetical protein
MLIRTISNDDETFLHQALEVEETLADRPLGELHHVSERSAWQHRAHRKAAQVGTSNMGQDVMACVSRGERNRCRCRALPDTPSQDHLAASVEQRRRSNPLHEGEISNYSMIWNNGAQERTRTFTTVKPLAPEASASTNSATWAWGA